MAKVTDQSIPSALLDKYKATLGSSIWLPDDWRVYKRIPFRIPELQGCRTIRPPIPRGSKVSDPMCAHRKIFGPCVQCFNKQPYSGGVTPPDIGPRNRSWWFTDAIGKLPWYFNYFMQQTIAKFIASEPPDWCSILATDAAKVQLLTPSTSYCNQELTGVGWGKFDQTMTFAHLDNPDYKNFG